MSYAIEVEALQKVFGRGKQTVRAVEHVEFQVKIGQVFGFLGPNGAGKSTTIRMILDMVRPTKGNIRIHGQPLETARDVLQSRVGAMVDGARFYPFLSGRDNLEVVAKVANIYDANQIDRLLEQVNMLDRADRLMKDYSTGMKQRVGLAMTLLGDPDLIILDEPTNGLDPKGIREIRQFIRDLVDVHGKTVFLSSHLLNEIEQICDYVVIINHGKMIQAGMVTDLLSGQAGLGIETDKPELAQHILSQHWQCDKDDAPKWLTIQASRNDTPHILNKLISADISVYQIIAKRNTLEDYFLDVTGDDYVETSHIG